MATLCLIAEVIDVIVAARNRRIVLLVEASVLSKVALHRKAFLEMVSSNYRVASLPLWNFTGTREGKTIGPCLLIRVAVLAAGPCTTRKGRRDAAPLHRDGSERQ